MSIYSFNSLILNCKDWMFILHLKFQFFRMVLVDVITSNDNLKERVSYFYEPMQRILVDLYLSGSTAYAINKTSSGELTISSPWWTDHQNFWEHPNIIISKESMEQSIALTIKLANLIKIELAVIAVGLLFLYFLIKNDKRK